MKDDRLYLDHILECLEWINRHTQQGQKAFLAERKTQSAVLRELQTLAESTKRLSDKLKKAHPEVSWQGIAGLRNVLVHDYLGIKLQRIWEIIERDLPILHATIEALQKETGESND